MNPVMKLKESTRFWICIVVLAIAEIILMIGFATSKEDEIIQNLCWLIINSVSILSVIIQHLTNIVRQRAEKEQEKKYESMA